MTVNDVEKLIKYWDRSSQTDWKIFLKLKKSRDYPQALFFLHLSLEKKIKSLVVKKTSNHAPFLHNLVLLISKTDLPLTESLIADLEIITKFNIEGRYPEDIEKMHITTTLKKVEYWEKKAKQILKYLNQKL